MRVKWLSWLAIFSILLASLGVSTPALAVSDDIVISQVYGGGGNAGATYTHDFVELFNRGTTSVSLAGWSIQYASATGTGNFGGAANQLTELPNVTLAPGQYLLIQEAQGSGGTTALPTPDVTDPTPIAMSGSGGKVALVTQATGLGCNGGSNPCSATQLALIKDLVGWDGANFYEGSPAPATTNPTAISRNGNGCIDTDNNAADFTVGAPTPRNTASPLNICSTILEPVINEFSASTAGTDVEFVEIFGSPNTDYSAYTLLEIEGDSGASLGTVDEVIAVGSTDAAGFWLMDLAANALENGSITLLLVKNFTGAPGNDLDTDNDGTFDSTPWEAIVDAVAVNDGGAGDLTYGTPVLGVSYDTLPFAPGGASRFPDGFDTDAATDWVRNDFDLAGIPGQTGSITIGEAYNTPGMPNQIYVEVCGDPTTGIYAVQGSGLASPLEGETVSVEGVVVGDFQTSAYLNGFHIQDPMGDGDASTSDGIFIYAPGSMDVSVGDAVRVRGEVSEFNGMTEITSGKILLCGSGSVAATEISLPVANLDELEPYEGMLVTFPQDLYISEYFNYDRYGEIVLSTARQFTPTGVVDPGPDAIALAEAYRLARITLDDGRTGQNPDPAVHPNGMTFDLTNLFRGGDVVQNVTGVLDYSFGLYRIQPTVGADYVSMNPRTAAPDEVGGNLKVASFNVLNYFTTLDSRGADTPEEFVRQRTKIIAAIAAINADVVGLIEIENNTEAIMDLVDGLNDYMGAGTYAYVDTGVIGTDEIKVAFIYKPATVSLVGSYAILDYSVDPRFIDTRNRPALAQTFMNNTTGGIFTAVVNHLKSKGSPCPDPEDPDGFLLDPDLGDGAGNCNLTRLLAAQAMVDWLATDPTGSGDDDFLIMGDLNSYDWEDPIDALLAGGYTDLVKLFQGEFAYSYVFDGQLGYLDHALAGMGLLGEVTGTTVWHINADEPDLIDYDMSFKKPAQDALYEPNAYRSSDHDPVIIGLEVCDEIAPTLEVSVTPTYLWPANHKYVDVMATITVGDNFDPNPVVTLVSVTSNEPDDGLGDGDTPNDIVIVDDTHILLRAERSGTGSGRIYTLTWEAMDACGNTTQFSTTVSVPFSMSK